MDLKNMLDEELPPPYSLRASDHASSSHNTQEISQTSHLQDYLTSLPTRLRMTQEAHSIQQSLDDAAILDLLLPEIGAFLEYLSSLRTTPKLAHLTLIPEAAVPRNAVLSGTEEMRQRGEPCLVARVTPTRDADGDEKKKKKKSASPHDSDRDASSGQDWSIGREFSDWGRFGEDPSSSLSGGDAALAQDMMWWRDEDMAHRLARHLQPAPAEPPAPLQTPVQDAVEQRLPSQKDKKGWFWGKKNNDSSRHSGSGSTSTFATKTVQVDVERLRGGGSSSRGDAAMKKAKEKEKEKNDGVRMVVSAEEVAFRSENDFGIMESTRGWAVVVVVHMKKT